MLFKMVTFVSQIGGKKQKAEVKEENQGGKTRERESAMFFPPPIKTAGKPRPAR
jgi:hypothetical protein